MTKVKVIRENKNAKLPTKGTVESAGMDLYANITEPIIIKPHETVKISSGIKMEIPKGYAGFIYARSGLSTKKSIALINKVGVIDSDFRGVISLPLHNYGTIEQSIEPNERVAQMIIQKYLPVELIEVNKLSKTERGDGGFGSTGTH